MIKKITAIILALVFCLCAVGCADVDPNAPEGMKSATLASDPFTLYVPEAWTDNTASGTSGAYYSAVDHMSVSARYHAVDISKDEHLTACVASLEAEYADAEFELLAQNSGDTQLGGKSASSISYNFNIDDLVMRGVQITTEHAEGGLVSLYFYCPEEEYEDRSEVFSEIRTAFVLGELTDGADDAIDKDTPEGMKRASNKDIEYRLYVPLDWVCDPENGVSDAYCPDCRANVTVTSYIPDDSMSIGGYFEECEKSYKKELNGYSRTDEPTKREVGGRDAYSYVYTATVEGVEIKIMQTVFIYDSSFYTITYTAKIGEDFDGHLDELDTILGEFKFR